jgi:hypothetical protein
MYIFKKLSTVKNSILILMISFLTTSFLYKAGAQSAVYTIKIAGVQIGTMNAAHTNANNMDYYKLVSNVGINFLMKIKVHYETFDTYRDNVLIDATVNSLINGRRYLSKTIWNGKNYVINCVSHKYFYADSARTQPIIFSVSKIYFVKPPENTEVFAETYGKISKIRYIETNKLVFEITNSQQIYNYNNLGSLINVEVVNSLKNFQIDRNVKSQGGQ